MKISVVIPAHNEEKNISGTIVALQAQDYPDYEIIVVDNASVDKTFEIAKKHNVKVVQEKRKGLLWAREAGRVNAEGDIIVNIDADCLPEKDWLSRGFNHFNEGIVAVTGPYDYYDGGTFFRYSSLLTQKHLYHFMNVLVQKTGKGAVLIGGNNFIRADILRKTNGYNTALTFYGEDTDTAKRVSKHGKVIFHKKLVMKTSARRFKNEGTLKIVGKYFYHFFKVLLGK